MRNPGCGTVTQVATLTALVPKTPHSAYLNILTRCKRRFFHAKSICLSTSSKPARRVITFRYNGALPRLGYWYGENCRAELYAFELRTCSSRDLVPPGSARGLVEALRRRAVFERVLFAHLPADKQLYDLHGAVHNGQRRRQSACHVANGSAHRVVSQGCVSIKLPAKTADHHRPTRPGSIPLVVFPVAAALRSLRHDLCRAQVRQHFLLSSLFGLNQYNESRQPAGTWRDVLILLNCACLHGFVKSK